MSDTRPDARQETSVSFWLEKYEAACDERDALRAELAALKGQKPLAWQERQARRMRDGIVTEWSGWYEVKARSMGDPLAFTDPDDRIPREWRALIALPAPTAQPVQSAKGLTVQADADGVWLNFAASTGNCALLNVERIADSFGGITSKALRDWTADVSAGGRKSLSAKMRAAGFTPRDRRLTCDECGAKFTAQMAPLHECEAPRRPCPLPEHLASLPVCPWCDKQQWDVCEHAEEAKVCGGHR